jgi:hypothetical protein
VESKFISAQVLFHQLLLYGKKTCCRMGSIRGQHTSRKFELAFYDIMFVLRCPARRNELDHHRSASVTIKYLLNPYLLGQPCLVRAPRSPISQDMGKLSSSRGLPRTCRCSNYDCHHLLTVSFARPFHPIRTVGTLVI